MVNDYNAFHFTCIGASHLKAGIVCQDSSSSGSTHNCKYAVVCDGHGGDDYFRSERGSQYAVNVFIECAADDIFLQWMANCDEKKKYSACIPQLIKSIITRWNNLVEEDISLNPFTTVEMCKVTEKSRLRYENGEHMQSAYGTTLIGVVLTDTFWFGIQIGDGKCVTVYEKDEFAQPIPWDDNCFLNVTTSICDDNAFNEFRFTYSELIPKAIIIASDGIDDSFSGDEKLYDFYRVVLNSFVESADMSASEELKDYLPVLSSKGSGDDMSIAMLIHTDKICTINMCERPESVFLKIEREGNFGGDRLSDTYHQTAELEAVPKIFSFSELDCGGFYNMSRSTIEIVSVDIGEVVIKVNSEEFIVTPQTPVEITQTDEETASDGHKFVAYDTLKISMKKK